MLGFDKHLHPCPSFFSPLLLSLTHRKVIPQLIPAFKELSCWNSQSSKVKRSPTSKQCVAACVVEYYRSNGDEV